MKKFTTHFVAEILGAFWYLLVAKIFIFNSQQGPHDRVSVFELFGVCSLPLILIVSSVMSFSDMKSRFSLCGFLAWLIFVTFPPLLVVVFILLAVVM